MSLITKVKISGITNLSDARYCSGMGVQYLGFNFVKDHKSYIAPEIFQEVTSWISGPELIGEFEDADPAYIGDLLENLSLDGIEVNRPDNLQLLSRLVKQIILKTDISHYTSLSALENDLKFATALVDYVLISKSGQANFPDENIFQLARHFPVLLGYGIDGSNIRELVKKTGIRGIALQGGMEEKVGFKDYDALAAILEALEEDD
jgi:phosphoribosylanthranilate isomerase